MRRAWAQPDRALGCRLGGQRELLLMGIEVLTIRKWPAPQTSRRPLRSGRASSGPSRRCCGTPTVSGAGDRDRPDGAPDGGQTRNGRGGCGGHGGRVGRRFLTSNCRPRSGGSRPAGPRPGTPPPPPRSGRRTADWTRLCTRHPGTRRSVLLILSISSSSQSARISSHSLPLLISPLATAQ